MYSCSGFTWCRVECADELVTVPVQSVQQSSHYLQGGACDSHMISSLHIPQVQVCDMMDYL